MADFRKLSGRVSVAPQIGPEDFRRAAEAGFRLVINNRPENEAPDQLAGEEARTLAEQAGLAYVHVPVRMQTLSMDDVEAMARALDSADGPALAYCASGTRSTIVWALAEAKGGADADGLIAAAREAGYDLEPYRATLERLASEQ